MNTDDTTISEGPPSFPRMQGAVQRVLQGPLARALGWNLIGAVVSRGAILVVNLIAARHSDADSFAMWTVAMTTGQMVAGIIGLGISGAATVLIAAERQSGETEARKLTCRCILAALLLSMIAFCALQFGAGAILGITGRSVGTIASFRSVAPLSALMLLNAILTGILYGWQDFKGAFVANVASGLLMVSLAVWRRNENVSSMTDVITSSLVIQTLILLTSSWKRKPDSVFDAIQIKPMLRVFAFGAKLAAAGFIILPVNWYLIIYLGKAEVPSIQLALFAILWQIRTAVNFLPGQVISTATPILARIDKSINNAEWQSVFTRTATYSVMSSVLPTCAGLALCLLFLPAYSTVLRTNYLSMVALLCLAVVEVANRLVSCVLVSSRAAGANILMASCYMCGTLLCLALRSNATAAWAIVSCGIGSLVACGPGLTLIKTRFNRALRADIAHG